MEFCYQSWNSTNFTPELYQICMFFATAKKLRTNVESQRVFFTSSTKCLKCQIDNRDVHEKSRNGHRKNILSSLWEPCSYTYTFFV